MKWADNGGGDFEQAPTGTHIARCIRIIDIGTQEGEYQGKPIHRRQSIVAWELPDALMTTGDYAGKPFVVSKFYTASLSEKANLRKDLVNWRGREFTDEELKGFDPANILGKCCMLSITANDKGKSRVTAVMALPKNTPVPKAVNETVFFSLDDFNPAVFDKLSKGIKGMVEKSPEYKSVLSGITESRNVGADFDDDIPF